MHCEYSSMPLQVLLPLLLIMLHAPDATSAALKFLVLEVLPLPAPPVFAAALSSSPHAAPKAMIKTSAYRSFIAVFLPRSARRVRRSRRSDCRVQLTRATRFMSSRGG